jgi:hypothetical protein
LTLAPIWEQIKNISSGQSVSWTKSTPASKSVVDDLRQSIQRLAGAPTHGRAVLPFCRSESRSSIGFCPEADFLPTWSTDRVRRTLGDTAPQPDAPLVLVGRDGRRRVVLAADVVRFGPGVQRNEHVTASFDSEPSLPKLFGNDAPQGRAPCHRDAGR